MSYSQWYINLHQENREHKKMFDRMSRYIDWKFLVAMNKMLKSLDNTTCVNKLDCSKFLLQYALILVLNSNLTAR